MQNKGLVKVFAVLLTLVCVFYLSFSFVTRHYMNKAAEYAKGDPKLEQEYIDSLSTEKVWLRNYTLKQCREMEISLGLDLKGGMNVVLEVSVGDVIKALADHKEDAAFNKSLASAQQLSQKSQSDFITLFIKEYHKLAPGARLSQLFATQQLKDKITQKSSDSEVEKVLREEVKAAIDNSYNVLRTRIDRFGVVQPNIQSLPDQMGRIMVELPGIKEPERVRKLLQGSANLEFWETYDSKEIVPYISSIDSKLRLLAEGKGVAVKDTTVKADSLAKDSTAVATAAKVNAKDSLLAALKGKSAKKEAKGTAAQMAQAKSEHPLLSIFQPNTNGMGCIVGYANYRDTSAINRYLAMKQVQDELPKDLRLKWGVKAVEGDKKAQTFELYAIKSTERNGRAPLEGDVVTDAKDVFDQYGKPAVSMSMNSEGSRRWALMTKQNIGKSIAIVLDGYVYSAPNVNSEISGGSSEISGHFTPEESKDLANVLKSGKMPAPAHIVQEDIIGPSLGQESINAGIVSFIVAIVVLMTFMCFMYGFIPGMIANGALLFNLFFTLGILSSFQAALTLSGIAGMVLTLGIAVDANVLIYERTKEELRAGKNVKTALSEGYSNAFSAIFDSNLTSIITGVILFYFGTGPIKGFATTLVIGIICSFFTAVFMTRVVYEHFMNNDKLLNLTFSSNLSKKLFVHTHYNFVGTNKKSFMVFGAILLICFGSFAVRGLSPSIDFTGGHNYVLQFQKPVAPENVRTLMANQFGDASVSVIALGTDGTKVRVSTNYRIQESGDNVDSEIENVLYKAVKDKLLTAGTSFETFKSSDIKAGGCMVSSQKVGPSVAKDITIGAIIAVVLSLIAIGLYILLRFRDISFSVGSVIGLTIDSIIIAGVYSLLYGRLPFSMEVDQNFIAAILTIIGYSINDKVVIFDRVREFFHLYPKHDRTELFNDSLNTTLARTINTSVCTLLVMLCIFILGAESIRSFAFALMVGIVVGTLTSLFVSAPIAFIMQQKEAKKHAKALEQ